MLDNTQLPPVSCIGCPYEGNRCEVCVLNEERFGGEEEWFESKEDNL